MKTLLTSTGLALILAMTPAVADQSGQARQADQTGSSAASDTASPGGADNQAFLEELDDGQWMASNMMGHEVLGQEDESIGRISDFVFDDDGSLVAVVVGVGEFLGIGTKDVAIRHTELDVSDDDDELQIRTKLSQQELEDAPEYDKTAQLKPGDAPAMPASPGGAGSPGTPGSPGESGTTPDMPGQPQ